MRLDELDELLLKKKKIRAELRGHKYLLMRVESKLKYIGLYDRKGDKDLRLDIEVALRLINQGVLEIEHEHDDAG